MDGPNFDDLSRRVGTSLSRRRALWSLGGVLGGLAAEFPDAPDAAGKKRKKKKKKGERCGSVRCRANQLCCDPANGVCCSKRGATCCNVGPGTGTCCAGPNRCGRPVANDAAPYACCPPERQWFTSAGLVRCCPTGTRSLGTGITSDDGPCCPEKKYCSTQPTGGKCCADGMICSNPATGQCCPEGSACGTFCCPTGTTCCGTGDIRVCCGSSAPVCATPCGNLQAACCTQAAYDNGQCCGHGGGGGG